MKKKSREAPKQFVPAELPTRNAWFPLLWEREEESVVSVSESVSLAAPRRSTWSGMRADDDGKRVMLKGRIPGRMSSKREVAGGAAAVGASPPSTPDASDQLPELMVPRQRNVDTSFVGNEVVSQLMTHVTKLEEENRKLQERIRKLEERRQGQQETTTENGTEGMMVRPKDKVTKLMGMLNEYLVRNADLMGNEMEGSDLIKEIMEIVIQWGRS